MICLENKEHAIFYNFWLYYMRLNLCFFLYIIIKEFNSVFWLTIILFVDIIFVWLCALKEAHNFRIDFTFRGIIALDKFWNQSYVMSLFLVILSVTILYVGCFLLFFILWPFVSIWYFQKQVSSFLFWDLIYELKKLGEMEFLFWPDLTYLFLMLCSSLQSCTSGW